MSDSFVTSGTVARQAPLSMGFPRQERWRLCHPLLQEIFLTQDLSQCLLHWQADSLPPSHPGSPLSPGRFRWQSQDLDLQCHCSHPTGTVSWPSAKMTLWRGAEVGQTSLFSIQALSLRPSSSEAITYEGRRKTGTVQSYLFSVKPGDWKCFRNISGWHEG